MRSRLFRFTTLAVGAWLAACAETTPILDSQFGEATLTLKALQTRDAAASFANAEKSADGMPGGAASNTIERYYKSYTTTPPPPLNIFIGNPSGGSN